MSETKQTAALEAAKTTFAEVTKDGKFNATKAAAIAAAAIERVVNKDGETVTFSADEKATFEGSFYPTVGNKMATMKTVLAHRGVEPDEEFMELLKEFFNPAAVQKQMEDAKKPKAASIRDWIK